MKHNIKISAILLIMFFITQLIGIGVIHAYKPETIEIKNQTGESINKTTYNLPFGMNPPEGNNPKDALTQIIISLVIAVIFMALLMKIRAEIFLRLWFFSVVALAIAITINAPFNKIESFKIIALVFAVVIAYIKVFKRNILVHNLSELLIYPGIAVIFVSILSIKTTVFLFILISVYDMYAVWHSGFMQKMAKYQIKKLRFFAGFFVPYLGKEQKEKLMKSKKLKRVKASVAILGGGDVLFPIILAGVVLNSLGFIQSLLISLGATTALAVLFYYSEKGKFYPAMPFISAGCLIALGISYLI